jgi:hypothetical protein
LIFEEIKDFEVCGWFKIHRSGFRVFNQERGLLLNDLGINVQYSGFLFRVYGLRLTVKGLWLMVYGLWCTVYGLRFMVEGSGFRV